MKYFIKSFATNAILYFFTSFFLLLSILIIFFKYSNKNFDIKHDQKAFLENAIYIELSDGIVVIQMLPSISPEHVEKIKRLISSGYFKKHIVYRKSKDFIVQFGPESRLKNLDNVDSKFLIKKESTQYNHKKGVVCSKSYKNGSHDIIDDFFVVLNDSGFLDGDSTIWGYVVSGMDILQNIPNGERNKGGFLDNPIYVSDVVVAYAREKKVLNSSAMTLSDKKKICN